VCVCVCNECVCIYIIIPPIIEWAACAGTPFVYVDLCLGDIGLRIGAKSSKNVV